MLILEKKPPLNFNFALPSIIGEEFRRIGDVHGERNKLRWAVASAAVLKLLEMPPETAHELIREVYGARHYPEVLAELVHNAKAQASANVVPLMVPLELHRALEAKAAADKVNLIDWLTEMASGTLGIIKKPIPPNGGQPGGRSPADPPGKRPGRRKSRARPLAK